jgi:hypothetical protein
VRGRLGPLVTGSALAKKSNLFITRGTLAT